VRIQIDAAGCNWAQLIFLPARLDVFLRLAGLGGPMAMTEVEKSSRSNMERTFYTKLGPTPAFPPSPTETGQVKPAQK
jgi:hypothetical protein